MQGMAFVEDGLTRIVLQRIIDDCKMNFQIVVKHGAGNIKSNISAYNKSAKSLPIIVLRDQDTIECAPLAVEEWLPKKIQNRRMLFHVIEHEIESWVMADREMLAKWLNCKLNDVPINPDQIIDPKQKIFSLVRHSPRKRLHAAILPHGTAKQGPEYNATLGQFVLKHWRLKTAVVNSRNLERFIAKLGCR